jgi:hypothetical protein
MSDFLIDKNTPIVIDVHFDKSPESTESIARQLIETVYPVITYVNSNIISMVCTSQSFYYLGGSTETVMQSQVQNTINTFLTMQNAGKADISVFTGTTRQQLVDHLRGFGPGTFLDRAVVEVPYEGEQVEGQERETAVIGVKVVELPFRELDMANAVAVVFNDREPVYNN